ncbi:MAG: glycosyltransferase [Nitrospiraceae bacterium]|nr:glycosyltransferase [Nitrospiraceae bacterium]
MFDEKLADYVINNDHNFPQLAANKLGWLFINGLEHYYEGLLSVFSVINVSSYPGFSDLLICKGHTQTSKGSNLIYIPYINIKLIKHLIIAISSFFLLARWAVKSKSRNKILVVYSMYAPFPVVSRVLSLCFRVKSILIVPDLPEHMRIGVPTPWYLKMLLRINRWQLYLFGRLFDGYIFLTKFMTEGFNVQPDRYEIIEGCVDSLPGYNSHESENSINGGQRILLYAGQLNAAYGVRILLLAFTSLQNPDYRLWICGSGPMREEVLRFCDMDKRIKYYGVITNDEVNSLCRKATALINPRTADGTFTKYSFPSKILEYLKSGKPTIICRLEGIPEEYYSHTYVVEDQNEAGFSKAIDLVLSKPADELTAFGRNSQKWVQKNKNNLVQVNKIIKIINKIIR